jgi:hypothetical protein
MATLAEIRAKLQSAQQNNNAGSGNDNAVFPHWNIAEGQTATVRFLPDADTTNTFFWIERAMIKLPFAGIKSEASSKPITVQVPCMEMWGETCPILTEVRPWYKDPSLKEQANKYWKKHSYLFQGFVVDSKLQEDGKTPENPIRRFIMSKQIFNIVKNALMDNEIEELPTDYVRGLDFKITKTTKGGYADYTTSNWSRRERALGDAERAAIEQYGLFNLKDFLPKKPGDVELKVIKEMFEASVNGEAFDMERWGQYYKPAGAGNNSNNSGNSAAASSTPAAPKTPAPDASSEDDEDTSVAEAKTPAAPAESSASTNASSRAQDLLAKIRNRQTPQ